MCLFFLFLFFWLFVESYLLFPDTWVLSLSSLFFIFFVFCFVYSTAANRDLLPGDSRGYRSAEEAARELTQGIRREGTKLAERWAALRDRTERWNADLDTTTNVNVFYRFFFFSPFLPLSCPSQLSTH